ncbi:MAG: hypothetical protein JJE30_11155 [Desulfuromonadales bacterium]|nr:hypothetical protein [Desulfuromonadales bacterium]
MPRTIVSQIVAAAPLGVGLAPSDVQVWKKTPFVNDLCAAVQESDMPALFSLMEKADWMVANLATSLLRKFKDDPKVRRQYVDVWCNWGRPLEVRLCVMYPLLDYPDLERELHGEFFATIMQNTDRFKAFALTYFATPNDVLPTAIDRIKTATPSKLWIYLCNALASPDVAGARAFIESNTGNSDQFVARVARTLLSQFWR